MQSTGHTSTQLASLVPMQGSVMMYGMLGYLQPVDSYGVYHAYRRAGQSATVRRGSQGAAIPSATRVAPGLNSARLGLLPRSVARRSGTTNDTADPWSDPPSRRGARTPRSSRRGTVPTPPSSAGAGVARGRAARRAR